MPLYVSCVCRVDDRGDEVRDPHGGDVRAVDMRHRSANAHGDEGFRHEDDEKAVADTKKRLEPK